ncbi:MAG TPA: biopolymer transporter ExbD [Rhizomicrobium sp.]|jgi:biopolymer transport protein ExbD|nr:biopolymer transporter ExbD [Rhizomicrobium sp.]
MYARLRRGRLPAGLLAATLPTIGYALEAPTCSAQIFVHANGVVDFDGASYSKNDKLKFSLIAFKKAHPNCIPHIKGDKDARLEEIGKVVLMLQEAGFLKVGYLTEPKK